MGTPVVLEWRNLNLTIEKSEFKYLKCSKRVEKKTILENVSGSLRSGQLVAILGQSGAGKTTLLAAVSQRLRGPLTGRIMVNNTEINRKTMTSISCFVPQFDVTIDTLTPSEHLYFMGELRLDRTWSRARKNQRVGFLLRELGLRHVANNRISTLSGGERKKLNLASDLLNDPPIMFCDEVTTGLDSYNARKVIGALNYLSNTNTNADAHSSANAASDLHANSFDDEATMMTTTTATMEENDDGMELIPTTESRNARQAKAIICSIHQPTSEIFQYFTHIILMYAGRCVFYGTAQQAIAHFSKLGFDCPATYNPADFYLKVLSTSTDDESKYQSFFQRPIELLRRSSNYKPPKIESIQRFNASEYKTRRPFWFVQMWLLVLRSLLKMRRSYRAIIVDTAWYIIPYCVMALIYHESTGRTQDSMRDVSGCLFIITCELIFTQAYGVMNYYPSQMPILRRETNEHIYQFSAYYVAEIINAIPICIIRSVSGFTITYLLAGFNTGFLLYAKIIVTLLVSAFTANAYGLFVSSFFEQTITELASAIDLIFMCLAGIYLNLSSVSYVRFISPFFFSNEALAILFWHDVTEIDCPSKYEEKCIRNGTEYLLSYSYKTEESDVLFDYFGLFTLAILMYIGAFYGIRRNIRSAGYY